ncbi:MAG: hypothetical protein IKV32_02060 [Muribaculaceae bacterium]|nr:hypothetical protein [Muribaculaceae bacterium]
MSSATTTGSRITSNAIMLYLRMAIAIVIGLYTSRIVLEQLGITDFGIYGVVGSIIAFTEFINSSLSNSFTRFFAYELGQSNSAKSHIFGAATIIAIIAAIAIIILGESIGLWYLKNNLNIPPTRINTASFAYHCCVGVTASRVLQIPFYSCIIAHEKISTFAYIEILNSAMRLGVALLLTYSTFDKLQSYSILIFGVTLIIYLCYVAYCIISFKECRSLKLSHNTLAQLSKFSGLDLYGTICYSSRTHGTALLLNSFFGVALNAANAIALSIQNLFNGISSNIITAFTPQIIKQYSSGNIKQMFNLALKSTRYTSYLFIIIAIPLILEMDFILHLWLGDNIPQYTSTFCQLIIITTGLAIPVNVLNSCIHATGKIRFLSLVIGSIYLLTLPLIYLCFSLGLNPNYAYISYIVIMIIVIIASILNTKHLIPEFSLTQYFWNTILPILNVTIISFFTTYIISHFIYSGIIHSITTIFIAIISSTITSLTIGLEKEERKQIYSLIVLSGKKR